MIGLIAAERAAKLDTARLSALRFEQWAFLGDDSSAAVNLETGALAGIPRLSLAQLLDECAWRLRRPFISWVGRLSQLNASQGALWWASPLASKEIYYGLLARLSLLACARALLEKGAEGTLLVCSTPALLAAVETVAHELGRVTQRVANQAQPAIKQPAAGSGMPGLLSRLRDKARQALGLQEPPPPSVRRQKQALLRSHGFRQQRDFQGERTALLFTWVDGRSFAPDGSYRDPHFGLLPEHLRQRGYRVAYLARVLPKLPYEEAARLMAACADRLLPRALYLEDDQVADLRQAVNGFEPDLSRCGELEGLPVAGLAQELVAQTRGPQLDALTFEPLLANLAAAGVRPQIIVHGCEGHAWEQVLALAARRHMPGTKVVGYDNLTFSRMIVSMYPAPDEWERRPLPDRVVSNGPAGREMMLAEGWPGERVAAGCGIRHTYLWQGERQAKPRPESGEPWRVLVASPIGFGDAVELVAKTCQALGGDAGFQVVVKCHPALKNQEVAQAAGAGARAANVSFVDTPVDQLLRQADLLICTGTAVALEGLSLGVPTAYLRSECFLNLDKLEAFPGEHWVVTTAEDIKAWAAAIGEMSPAALDAWRKRAGEAVKSALAPPSPEALDAFLM